MRPRVLLIILLLLVGSAIAEDLTGTWTCDDGGTYLVTQEGSTIRWTGRSADGGRHWTHDFRGKLEGNRIVGMFKDRTSGKLRNGGPLELKVEDSDHFTMVNPGAGFFGRHWVRTPSQQGF